MEINLKDLKIKKAFGLIEVLIALIFVASTMILSIQIVAKGLKASKDNEIRDNATGIMLRALEYNQIDLPDAVRDADFSSGILGVSKCYKLDKVSPDSDEVILKYIASPCDGTKEMVDCGGSYNNYRLDNTPGLDICNQVIFTNLKANAVEPTHIISDDKIRITSRVVYIIDGQEIIESVDTYRRL